MWCTYTRGYYSTVKTEIMSSTEKTHGAEEHHVKENIRLRKTNITYFPHMRRQNLEKKRVG